MFSLTFKRGSHRDTWMVQLAKHPTLAHVMVSEFVTSSPTSGSVRTARSLELALDSVCLSLCPSPARALSLCLSKTDKHYKKKKKREPQIREVVSSVEAHIAVRGQIQVQGTDMSSMTLHLTFTQCPKHCLVPSPLTKLSMPQFPVAHYTPATVASCLFQEPAVPPSLECSHPFSLPG